MIYTLKMYCFLSANINQDSSFPLSFISPRLTISSIFIDQSLEYFLSMMPLGYDFSSLLSTFGDCIFSFSLVIVLVLLPFLLIVLFLYNYSRQIQMHAAIKERQRLIQLEQVKVIRELMFNVIYQFQCMILSSLFSFFIVSGN